PVIIMDIKDCFFSIPLDKQDSKRFAFTLPSVNLQEPARRYQWTVLPQGMKNSPTICQMTVAAAIQGVRKDNPTAVILHYMDDLLLSAETPEKLEIVAMEVI
ncbi:POK8 protein, partial [Ciconia maguari]|nr:POK8 protein [Ciconia maguari]